jgi:hypothetical protein
VVFDRLEFERIEANWSRFPLKIGRRIHSNDEQIISCRSLDLFERDKEPAVRRRGSKQRIECSETPAVKFPKELNECGLATFWTGSQDIMIARGNNKLRLSPLSFQPPEKDMGK